MQGTALHWNTAYHPQSDGLTKVVNKTLEGCLRCFINGKPKNWARWLSWAEYWYNTSYHASTKFSPFPVVCGREPPHLILFFGGSTTVGSLEEQLLQRDTVLDDSKPNLMQAQQRMKLYEDEHHRKLEYVEGNHVYLKL